jgi:hypothetical protein
MNSLEKDAESWPHLQSIYLEALILQNLLNGNVFSSLHQGCLQVFGSAQEHIQHFTTFI